MPASDLRSCQRFERDQQQIAMSSSSSSSWKKKRPRTPKPGKYKFHPAEVPSCPIELRSGKGLSIVQSIGLEHFLLHAEMPKMNDKLCTAFISSYNPKAGFGVVNGVKAEITAESVAEVTGLPMGTSNCPAAQLILTEDKLLHGFVPSTAKRFWHGYDLEQLKHAATEEEEEEEEEGNVMAAVGRRMMQKMLCRIRFVQYASAGVLVGIDTAIRKGIEMAWAEFMARTMKKAVAHTKRGTFFVFGEWLTGLLEHALATKGHIPPAPLSAERKHLPPPPLSAERKHLLPPPLFAERKRHLPPGSSSSSERKILFDYQQELQRRLLSCSPVTTIEQQNAIVVIGDEMERMKAEMREVLDIFESHLVSWKGKTEGLITELAEERKARKEAEARAEQAEESQMELEEMIEDLARRRDDLELENLRLREELEQKLK